LGNNIGHPVKGDFDQELKDAIVRVREAAKAAGKWSGIYCPNGDVARKYADEGFQMVRSALRSMSQGHSWRVEPGLSNQRYDRYTNLYGAISVHRQRHLGP